MSQKWFFWNYGFYLVVQNNLSEKSSHAKCWLFSALNSWDTGFWSSNCFILNSYLVLVPTVRNRCEIREVSMGLCETSNFSIFTFINVSDLTFCPHSNSSCIYLLMRSKSSNGKICKMMRSHFRTLWWGSIFMTITTVTSNSLGTKYF